jgi:hypothetical protein
MEFIKLIAPWLPIPAIVYILIECRYFMLVLFYASKRKMSGHPFSAPLNDEPSVVSATADQYSRLMKCRALLIFNICLSNTKEKYVDAEHRHSNQISRTRIAQNAETVVN